MSTAGESRRYTARTDSINRLARSVEDLKKQIESRPSVIEEGLRALSKDMHQTSSRGCSTCEYLTKVMGWPFGCYEYQERKRRLDEERSKG